MSGQDDPFADQGDIDATVVRPSPGGRRPLVGVDPPSPAAPQPQAPPPQRVRSDDSLFGPQPGLAPPQPPMAPQAPPVQPMSPGGAAASPLYAADTIDTDYSPSVVTPASGSFPLVVAAQPLLTLASRLRERPTMADVQSLHDRVVSEMKVFERRARGGGATSNAVNAGRYALCAAIDDLVLSTPWGPRSVWASMSMVNTFYNETWGGERFFEILEQLHRAPNQNGDVLELMYLCLSLGFEGRYRVLPRGQIELARVRENLYRTIRRRTEGSDRGLSPHWRGVAAAHRPLGTVIPLWVIGVVAFALLVLLFLTFRFLLHQESDPVFNDIARLQPVSGQMVSIAREAPEPPAPAPAPQPAAPEPPPQPPEETLYDKISGFLQPEVDEGLVVVTDEANSVNIRLVGDNLFRTGSAQIGQAYVPVIRRIAAALEEEPGAVEVQGHTDNQPFRIGTADPNFRLSLNRAETVAEILSESLSDPTRLSAEGRASADQLCFENTAACHARNRRVEILLLKEGQP